MRHLQDSQARQLELPELEAERPSIAGNGDSSFSDPAFVNNKALPVHRWVPWIAGFSSDFVRDALTRYLDGKATVLDPFAGVGTTLMDAVLLGHDVVGFEINPYAALACRTKVSAHRVAVEELHREIARFRSFYQEKVSTKYSPRSAPPSGFRTRSPFYSPQVLHKVLIVQDFIGTVGDSGLQDLFRLAFASTMVSYSNYSYEPSLGRRASVGKQDIKDFPVGQAILHKLAEMAEDLVWLKTHLVHDSVDIRVINDSFFRARSYLATESVDLVITSPPYLNNYHYNRNTRPQLYWLGYVEAPQDLNVLEESNFGKYWQTVREKERVELNFALPGTDIVERLQALRSVNPNRGIYGGNGWANYAASYFNDCYRFATGLKYVLKPGGTALVVIGNSILQGIFIPTDQYLAKIAESLGLELLGVDIPRATRVGNSIIQSGVRVVKAQGWHQLYEAVVQLRKR